MNNPTLVKSLEAYIEGFFNEYEIEVIEEDIEIVNNSAFNHIRLTCRLGEFSIRKKCSLDFFYALTEAFFNYWVVKRLPMLTVLEPPNKITLSCTDVAFTYCAALSGVDENIDYSQCVESLFEHYLMFLNHTASLGHGRRY